jgi:hypothetical protein
MEVFDAGGLTRIGVGTVVLLLFSPTAAVAVVDATAAATSSLPLGCSGGAEEASISFRSHYGYPQ